MGFLAIFTPQTPYDSWSGKASGRVVSNNLPVTSVQWTSPSRTEREAANPASTSGRAFVAREYGVSLLPQIAGANFCQFMIEGQPRLLYIISKSLNCQVGNRHLQGQLEPSDDDFVFCSIAQASLREGKRVG